MVRSEGGLIYCDFNGYGGEQRGWLQFRPIGLFRLTARPRLRSRRTAQTTPEAPLRKLVFSLEVFEFRLSAQGQF